jgi:hypothetical protein
MDNVGLGMTESKRIQELNRKIKHLKKTGTGGSDFRLLIRLTVLVASYQKQPIERAGSRYFWVKISLAPSVEILKNTATSLNCYASPSRPGHSFATQQGDGSHALQWLDAIS